MDGTQIDDVHVITFTSGMDDMFSEFTYGTYEAVWARRLHMRALDGGEQWAAMRTVNRQGRIWIVLTWLYAMLMCIRNENKCAFIKSRLYLKFKFYGFK